MILDNKLLVPVERVERTILLVRGKTLWIIKMPTDLNMPEQGPFWTSRRHS